MLTWDAWHFPADETHLPKRMRKFNLRVPGLDGVPRHTYQYPLYERALRLCGRRHVAVDVGAHIGLFSYWMVRDFGQVVAFEPVTAHAACWQANVPRRPQDELHACALGARADRVSMATTPGSSGGTWVAGRGGDVAMHTLDSFGLRAVDLLKVDCEGYELEVLRGAEVTLRRTQPVVIVEQRPAQVARFGHGPADAVAWLQALGARVAWTDRRDYITVFG